MKAKRRSVAIIQLKYVGGLGQRENERRGCVLGTSDLKDGMQAVKEQNESKMNPDDSGLRNQKDNTSINWDCSGDLRVTKVKTSALEMVYLLDRDIYGPGF